MPELKDTLPATQVVAMGYTIVGRISDDAQITFNHAIAEDEDDASVNAKIDRIMTFIDRQRLKYEEPSLQKELDDLVDKLAQIDGDIANAENNFNKAVADQQVQVDHFRGEIKRITDEGYTKHKSSGRGGSYTPQGAAKQQIAAAQAGIESMIAQNQKAVAERQLVQDNLENNKQRMINRSEVLRTSLADIAKLVT